MDNFQPVDDSTGKRSDLEAMAVDMGLANVKKYQNKGLVIDAINRVGGGEDAKAVDAEFYQAPAPADDADDDSAKSDKVANGAVNLGHPRHFDETGNPVYLADEV